MSIDTKQMELFALQGGFAIERIKQAEGQQAAVTMAAGYLKAIRDFYVVTFGPRTAYNFMAGVADDILTPILPK